MTCSLIIDVPVVSECGTHRADLRATVGRLGRIPDGARVKLRCSRATYFLDWEVQMLADHLRPAAILEIESENAAFAVSIHALLSSIWTSEVAV
jgi:hypothetical protein